MAVTKTRFFVGESNPSAIEVAAGAPIVNNYGNLTLADLIPDPMDDESTVELDTSVEPPVLRINGALATAAFGSTVDGEFVRYGHELDMGAYVVDGTYDGTSASELFLRSQPRDVV